MAATVAIVGTAHVAPAAAASFDLGNPDWSLRWDNTVTYTAAARVKAPDPKVAESPMNFNVNDGDRNFKKGLIENRFDLLTEADLTYRKMAGLRVSAAAWYDTVYNHTNDNTSNSVNQRGETTTNHFNNATERLMGRKAELVDGFVWGTMKLPESMSLGVKAGQFTQLYGESLFLGSNAFAGAQATIDIVKALSMPAAQFKDIGMPTPQLSASLRISPKLTVQGYYQLRWRADRLPASGSYFSFADFAGAGAETLFVPGLPPAANIYLQRSPDMKASNSGQGGGIIKYKLTENWEVGVFGANFHAKNPKFYARPGVNAQGGAPGTPTGLSAGDYLAVYPEDIKVYGATFATVVGDTNISGEASMRTNQPLASPGADVITASAACNNTDSACYAVGKTFHANVSSISLLSATPFWDGASLVGELGFNHLISHDNAAPIAATATRSAWGARATFEPHYFQVLPSLDITTPITVGYAFGGRSVLGPTVFGPEWGGDLTLGIKGVYRERWKAGLNYTHYFGAGGTITDSALNYSYNQFWKDRDYFSLSLQTTF